jgi:hypothetical protein
LIHSHNYSNIFLFLHLPDRKNIVIKKEKATCDSTDSSKFFYELNEQFRALTATAAIFIARE